MAQPLAGYLHNAATNAGQNAVITKTQFNGYTNHWFDEYKQWVRYGNLFKISLPDVPATIEQAKIDIAEDMKLPGLLMQEGFIYHLANSSYSTLKNPSIELLEKSASETNVLVFIDSAYSLSQLMNDKIKNEIAPGEQLKSHQYNAAGFKKLNAFYLEKSGRKIFVVIAPDTNASGRLNEIMLNTLAIIKTYDLHKGWFGAETLLKSVTCTQGHPLEVIGKGMNEGADWFTFSGYMDFLAKDELTEWMKTAGDPAVVDVGFSQIYGLNDYQGLQVQDMGGQKNWIEYAHKKGGYIFRPVYDTACDAYKYDGYIASAGNKEQIDNEDIPFISTTGTLSGDALSSMVLFTKKGDAFTKEKMWQAILNRKEVAVLGGGKMMGPAYFRNALQLLLLDRVFLEEYFADRIDLQAGTEGYTLQVTVSNTYNKPVEGIIRIKLPPGIVWDQPFTELKLNLPANSTKTLQYKVWPTSEAMDKTNPIVVNYTMGTKTKTTLTMMHMPKAISVHRLLYGHTPVIKYPVSIHNFSQSKNVPVQVQVFKRDNSAKAVFSASQIFTTEPGSFIESVFDLKLAAGDYNVKVSALGLSYTSQLGVGKKEGQVSAYEVDLDGDGINEYRMENDSVQISLLATGARVIEYIVKSRSDNVLFKLWPKKPEDDKRQFRKYGFYPYGGFEDFLGQASMETHQVYDAKMVKKEGDYVQVIMTTDYFGNKLEKTYTLYGNSPLLEVRYALKFKNPEANVIGPQPILELGKTHGPEDLFIAPDKEGMLNVRMRMQEYFGRVINLKEGWNAGYDTKEDVCFAGAYPVTQPLFLHMWMNHPSNGESHYYYSEFQPWVPIIQKTTMYFTYYLWGAAGSWENAVNELRKRNLITER